MVFSFPNPLPTARAFVCHRHDGTQQTLVHPTKPYSPNCLEEGSSRKPAFSRTNPYTLGPWHHLISERASRIRQPHHLVDTDKCALWCRALMSRVLRRMVIIQPPAVSKRRFLLHAARPKNAPF